MELQKNDLQKRELAKNLIVALTPKTGISTKLVDKVAVNIELRKYKTESGAINYPAIFDIPKSQRLPEMAKNDLGGTIKLVTVAVTLAMESLNLVRPMTNSQIVDLAEAIVDSLNEGDNLALEDLMLFLQKLTRGEYPELYEGIDQAKFMNRLSKYRDERFEAAMENYYARHQQYKEMGDSRRERSVSDNPLDVHLHEMSNKVQDLKDQLKEQKDINKRLQEDF